MESGFKSVTPKLAAEWLKANTNNRRLRQDTVKKYAADMKAGRWEEGNTDPIVFNTEGVLENGQHRLHAVIASGATVRLFVIRGAKSAMGTYDIGAGRTTEDFLHFRGVNVGPKEVSLVRLVLNQYGIKTPTNAMIERYMSNHMEMIQNAWRCVMYGSRKPLAKTAPCATAAYAALRCGVDEDVLRSFFGVMNTGYMVEQWQTAPISARNMFLAMKQSGRAFIGGATLRKDMRGVTEWAIKDFAEGVSRKKAYQIKDKSPYFPRMEDMDAEEVLALLE